MSTRQLADRSLFARLIDDAAVFPPGLAPVGRALTEHVQLRGGPFADLIGPLLIPATDVGELLDVAARDLNARDDTARLSVVLIARPGTPVGVVSEALDRLRGHDRLRVVGAELAATVGWAAALAWDLPLALEVSRDRSDQQRALDALAGAAEESVSLVAKLRTQSSPGLPVPSAQELADFLLRCAEHDLGCKLTGGLHHAVAQTVTTPKGSSEDQHGILNVLLAVHRMVTGGSPADMVDALLERDSSALAESVAQIDTDDVGQVRGQLTSYGCCGVLDPIEELVALGLLAEPGGPNSPDSSPRPEEQPA